MPLIRLLRRPVEKEISCAVDYRYTFIDLQASGNMSVTAYDRMSPSLCKEPALLDHARAGERIIFVSTVKQ